MSNLTGKLKQLSFEKIEFPYREITVDGAMREHTHIYPHSAGGAPEKLGRDLYVFDITCAFRGDLLPERYRKLWPKNLESLVALFEQGKTGDLFLPQIGAPIRAFCTNWKRVLKSTITNGEDVTLKFKEDAEALRLPSGHIIVNAQGLADAFVAVQTWKPKTPSLLDRILDTVSTILALKDQADLYSALAEAKCLSAIQMMRDFLETSEAFMNPDIWTQRDMLHELLAQVIAVRDDIQGVGLTTKIWTVQRVSTLAEVSMAIYGRSTRASELMSLNTIPDPFAIPAGTNIRYYEA